MSASSRSRHETAPEGSTDPPRNESEPRDAAPCSTAPHHFPTDFVDDQSPCLTPSLPENFQEIMSEAQAVALESQNAARNAALEARHAALEARHAAMEARITDRHAAMEARNVDRHAAMEARNADRHAAMEARHAAMEALYADRHAAMEAQHAAFANRHAAMMDQSVARNPSLAGHAGFTSHIEPGNWSFHIHTDNSQVPSEAVTIMGGNAASVVQNAAMADENTPLADQSDLEIETDNLKVPLQGVTVTGRNLSTNIQVMIRRTGNNVAMFSMGTRSFPDDSNTTAAGIDSPEDVLELFQLDSDSKVYDDPELNKCQICLELLKSGEDACFLPCAHLFHGPCICGWLKMNAACPTCRTAIP